MGSLGSWKDPVVLRVTDTQPLGHSPTWLLHGSDTGHDIDLVAAGPTAPWWVTAGAYGGLNDIRNVHHLAAQGFSWGDFASQGHDLGHFQLSQVGGGVCASSEWRPRVPQDSL